MQEIKTTVTQYSCSLWQYFSAFMIVDTSLFLRSEGLIMAGKYMCFYVCVSVFLCVCVCVCVCAGVNAHMCALMSVSLIGKGNYKRIY